MLLSILTAHYKEPYKTIRHLLTSIALQQEINFDDIQMVICNDGSEVVLDENKLKRYPFEIEYHVRSKTNVSQTKQACLDHAKGNYIMFCDSDDMFTDILALRNLFDILRDESPDIVVSDFARSGSYDENGNPYVSISKASEPFLHGKIYKREYLIDNHISMNPNFEVLEDMYFTFLALDLADPSKIVNIDGSIFYLKKDNSDSLTQNNPDFYFYRDIYMIDVGEALIEEYLRRGNSELAQCHFLDLLYMTYYKLNLSEWLNKRNKKYRGMLEERFALFYSKYRYFYDLADKDFAFEFKESARESSISAGFQKETVSFEDWLQHIQDICAEQAQEVTE